MGRYYNDRKRDGCEVNGVTTLKANRPGGQYVSRLGLAVRR